MTLPSLVVVADAVDIPVLPTLLDLLLRSAGHNLLSALDLTEVDVVAERQG